MYSCRNPHSRANASASRLCDSGIEAESAVIAIASSPRTRYAAQARYAESVPPEYATITRRMDARMENSFSCFWASDTASILGAPKLTRLVIHLQYSQRRSAAQLQYDSCFQPNRQCTPLAHPHHRGRVFLAEHGRSPALH